MDESTLSMMNFSVSFCLHPESEVEHEKIQGIATGRAICLICSKVFLSPEEYHQEWQAREQQFRGHQEIAQLIVHYQDRLQKLERDQNTILPSDQNFQALSTIAIQQYQLRDRLALLAYLTGFVQDDGIAKKNESKKEIDRSNNVEYP